MPDPRKPLTAAERLIYGDDAVRDPVTGIPIARGHGAYAPAIQAGLCEPVTSAGLFKSEGDAQQFFRDDTASQSEAAAEAVSAKLEQDEEPR